jgi:hypothetical protein
MPFYFGAGCLHFGVPANTDSTTLDYAAKLTEFLESFASIDEIVIDNPNGGWFARGFEKVAGHDITVHYGASPMLHASLFATQVCLSPSFGHSNQLANRTRLRRS